MATPLDSQASSASASEEAGSYFRYMAQFVGFTDADAKAIRQSALVVEKHLPEIIARFYTNLLQYPPTRKIFLKKDGSVDEDYLQLRMLHQANFWRRTSGGVYDDDYARFVDYVGRAHTSRGADPHIYIAERYVIGMVGFVQHAIIDALMKELNGYDEDLEMRAIKAWNKLCMVLLEMLARAYGEERLGETLGELVSVNPDMIFQMSVESYEKGLGIHRPLKYTDVQVARVDEIPDGDRRIVEINGISIGVFHHKGSWYALRNSCLHRGGPVATGKLVGDHLVCPWHGYTYDVTDGKLLMDPSARLEMYAVSVHDGNVYLRFPEAAEAAETSSASQAEAVTEPEAATGEPELKENEFFVSQLKPGDVKLLFLKGRRVAVYNVAGAFYATQEECTHAGGPLSEGELDGKVITCPWHDSCFDVTDGAVVCKPATQPLETFSVAIHGEIGRVEVQA
jgi:nitrite reductase/ring-hydroxylating ferredoxin subunit/hemoglobin-like flavoprotein